MKNGVRLSILSCFFGSAFAAFSQDGQIIFKNVGIQKVGSFEVYNVPLYEDQCRAGNSTTGAGLFPGGMTVGLFTAGSIAPLATALLGTTAQTAPFIATPVSQTVIVTGSSPGSTPTLIVRAWSTAAGSFRAAQSDARFDFGEWSFTSQPLGGTPPGGGLPIPPPSLTGWGPENGSGFIMLGPLTCPEPSAIALGVLGLAILVIASRSVQAPQPVSGNSN